MTSLNLPPPTELYRETLYYKVKPIYNLEWLETLDPAAREYLPKHTHILGDVSHNETLKKVQDQFPKFKIDSVGVYLPGSPLPPALQDEREAEWLSWLNLHSTDERNNILSALIFNRGLPEEVVDDYSFMKYLETHPDVYEKVLEGEDEPDDDQSSCSSDSSDSSSDEDD